MYAIIKTGGKQYKIRAGEIFRVERLPGDVGQTVSFDQVLMLSDETDSIKVGKPTLEGVRVDGVILKQGKGKKIIVFKKKRRKSYEKKNGHRQYFTEIKVNEFGLEGAVTATPVTTETAPQDNNAVAEA
ncbi:MAG: 50S ribosomal protein L21 [Deltaproteobacteria bacterium]|nr:50S ribosomal protein L21 [Deltaproteobacteria bacterium]MBF0524455.1 50S ribosomal protein L21 [Deltaproteobacteria bacterium]